MDFRTTIEYRSDDKQLVLASQEMSTFYCIYATFKNESIEFESKCYKGCVNIKVKKVEPIISEGKYKHIRIFTSINQGSTKDRTVNVSFSPNDILICERESELELPEFLVSEENYINLDNNMTTNRVKYETQYQVERRNAKVYIDELINKKNGIRAASGNFCVIGVSKVI